MSLTLLDVRITLILSPSITGLTLVSVVVRLTVICTDLLPFTSDKKVDAFRPEVIIRGLSKKLVWFKDRGSESVNK